jgi:hypothetical protein
MAIEMHLEDPGILLLPLIFTILFPMERQGCSLDKLPFSLTDLRWKTSSNNTSSSRGTSNSLNHSHKDILWLHLPLLPLLVQVKKRICISCTHHLHPPLWLTTLRIIDYLEPFLLQELWLIPNTENSSPLLYLHVTDLETIEKIEVRPGNVPWFHGGH